MKDDSDSVGCLILILIFVLAVLGFVFYLHLSGGGAIG